MAEKKSRSFYNNKNGNMEMLEFLALVSDEEKYDNFLRKHSTIKDRCPPFTLLELNTDCFKCISCFNGCKDKIKKTKTGFSHGNKKYTNEEVEKWIQDNLKEELDD